MDPCIQSNFNVGNFKLQEVYFRTQIRLITVFYLYGFLSDSLQMKKISEVYHYNRDIQRTLFHSHYFMFFSSVYGPEEEVKSIVLQR